MSIDDITYLTVTLPRWEPDILVRLVDNGIKQTYWRSNPQAFTPNQAQVRLQMHAHSELDAHAKIRAALADLEPVANALTFSVSSTEPPRDGDPDPLDGH